VHASFACADKAEGKRETTNPALASFAFCLLPFALTPTVSSTRQPCWLPNHPQRRRMTALRGRRSELRYPRLLSASGEGIDRQACRAVITVQPGGGCKPGIWTRQKAEGKTFTLAERFAFCLLPSALTLTTSLSSLLSCVLPVPPGWHRPSGVTINEANAPLIQFLGDAPPQQLPRIWKGLRRVRSSPANSARVTESV